VVDSHEAYGLSSVRSLTYQKEAVQSIGIWSCQNPGDRVQGACVLVFKYRYRGVSAKAFMTRCMYRWVGGILSSLNFDNFEVQAL
jgi:hypothetical protein